MSSPYWLGLARWFGFVDRVVVVGDGWWGLARVVRGWHGSQGQEREVRVVEG